MLLMYFAFVISIYFLDIMVYVHMYVPKGPMLPTLWPGFDSKAGN